MIYSLFLINLSNCHEKSQHSCSVQISKKEDRNTCSFLNVFWYDQFMKTNKPPPPTNLQAPLILLHCFWWLCPNPLVVLVSTYFCLQSAALSWKILKPFLYSCLHDCANHHQSTSLPSISSSPHLSDFFSATKFLWPKDHKGEGNFLL